MPEVRWKRGAFGALATLCALVNLRCGNTSNDLFQGSGGDTSLPSGGASGVVDMGGTSSTLGGLAEMGGAGALGNGGASAGAGVGVGGSSPTAGSGGANGADAGSGGALAGAGGSSGANAGNSGGGDVGMSGTGGIAGMGGASGSAGAGGASGSAGAGGASGSAGAGGASGSAGAGGASGSAGAGGASGSAGAGGASGSAGAGGASGSAGAGGASGSAGAGGSCSAPPPTFTPRAPIVDFVVDRSSTMFAPSTMYWAPVRTSVLQVVNTLQDQIKFGFSAYTGVQGTTCPLDLVTAPAPAPALDDYDTINATYSATDSAGPKTESPTAAALAAMLSKLGPSAGTGSGAKFVFLITDGGQDFCNDGDNTCAADAVVYELQALKAAGISSKVFGIKGSTNLGNGDLQNFTNAGAGVGVTGNAPAIYGLCHGAVNPAWTQLYTSLGRTTNQALGTYQMASLSTPTLQLDTTNPDSMNQTLLSAAAATKSCTFDVSGSGINAAKAAQGSVTIDGVNVPLNANNGWHLTSATVLDLVGSACTKWQAATSSVISFDFPCQSLL